MFRSRIGGRVVWRVVFRNTGVHIFNVRQENTRIPVFTAIRCLDTHSVVCGVVGMRIGIMYDNGQVVTL